MSVRGTRNLFGAEAHRLRNVQHALEEIALRQGYQPFIPSCLAEHALFAGNVGANRMYEFTDLGGRELVLIPEVTAIARQEFRESWSKSLPKPVRLFYTSKCWRYDRPQRGRYREFTQFGLECMPDVGEVLGLLPRFLESIGLLNFELRALRRDQAYYTDGGAEAWVAGMQVAGGGPYAEGAGWAIGIERLVLALDEQEPETSKTSEGGKNGSKD